MANNGYDPNKAATWNQLIKQGISVTEAGNQAGISDDERDNYVVGEDGTVGAEIAGGGKLPISAFQPGEAETDPDFVTRVPYNVKAKNLPSTRTSDEVTDTSTEQYGGKAVFIPAIKPKDTAASRALQPAIDASYEKSEKFLEENPSAYARKKLGLPKMSAAEQAAWNKQDAALGQERRNLIDQQNDLKTPGVEAKFEIPNTTNNTVTTTFGTESTNAPVESADAALAQQQELQAASAGDQVPVAEPVQVQSQVAALPIAQITALDSEAVSDADPYAKNIAFGQINAEAGPSIGQPEVVIDDPQAQPLLTQEQSIARAQGNAPAADPAAAAADFNANTSTSVLKAIGVKEPAPVDANNTGQQGQSTISGARGGNVQENEQLEAARQAAREAELKQQAAIAAEFQSPASGDWRVTLRLAREANYLYMAEDNPILAPLKASRGVIFPYMPSISTSYNADYDVTDLTHSNYRGNFYKSSYVGDVQLTGVFTAQDTAEANYLLAVIHFFRSVTKMFYGANDPLRGAPPPLVYLSGLGQYQFNNHPCVVKTFNYSLPNDCDYIRTKPNNYNVNLNNRNVKTDTGPTNAIDTVINRLRNAALPKGALPKSAPQSLLETQSVYNIDNSTYVPTKCEISISLAPIQTRSQQSQQFSFQDYANGRLLKGGGFW